MRSSLLALVVVAGCAKGDQVKQCYPVSSWAMPVFNCEGEAAPVVIAPPPEPPKPDPIPEPPKVEVKEERIDLREKVNFETNKAELLPASKKLLDEVVSILKEHPEIERVRIEGHTDNEASNPYNQKLSESRAKSVRAYLIEKGIEGKRLEAKGFGETKPVADNGTPDGRETNRRVELHIVKRKAKT